MLKASSNKKVITYKLYDNLVIKEKKGGNCAVAVEWRHLERQTWVMNGQRKKVWGVNMKLFDYLICTIV